MKSWQSLALGCLVVLSPSASRAMAQADRTGVLILAHGGSAEWNRAVQEAVDQARLPQPHEIAFGMGMRQDEVARLGQAIQALQAQGIERIVVVPLAISADSDVMRQWAYLLHLRTDGPWTEGIEPVQAGVPLEMTGALEDDPAVAEVLVDRARTLSRSPGEETVILVAHGPVSDQDDARWLDMMNRLAAQLKDAVGFREVAVATLRDDAPKPVLDAATDRLRRLVEEHGQEGSVLVIPLLVARGGIEQKIPQRLEGLRYVFDGAPLLPHPAISRWIARRFTDLLRASEAGAGRSRVLQ